MAVNPDKNIVEQSLIARLIGKIKRIALDIGDSVSAETSRATAAEAAAKTEVVQGENCTIEKTTASDGHDVYTVNADGKPQVQADWNQADSSEVDYIKNKPNLALKENVANKSQSIDPTSTTEYGSSKAVADFVNSSVATNTANFLGSFSLADLSLTYPATDVQIAAALNSHTWPSGVSPTNNDYVYVEIQDPQTTGIDDKVERFKYSGLLESWGYEYTLNNSSFTAAEMATLESGITASDKTAWNNHVSNTSNPHQVTAAQVGAEPAFSVLPIAKGGTGANTIKGALSTLTSETQHYDTLPTDDALIVHKFGTATASNGALYTRKLSYLWTYIQNKISSVLGLTATEYGGSASRSMTIYEDGSAGMERQVHIFGTENTDGLTGWRKIATITKLTNSYSSARICGKIFASGGNWGEGNNYENDFQIIVNFTNSKYYIYHKPSKNIQLLLRLVEVSPDSVYEVQVHPQGASAYSNFWVYAWADKGPVTWSIAWNDDLSVTGSQGTVLTNYDLDVKKFRLANGQVGSTTIPVYVDSNGQVKVCDPSQMSVGSASTASTASAAASGSALESAINAKQDTVSTDTDSSAFDDNTAIATGFSSDKLHLNVASRLWNYIRGKILGWYDWTRVDSGTGRYAKICSIADPASGTSYTVDVLVTHMTSYYAVTGLVRITVSHGSSSVQASILASDSLFYAVDSGNPPKVYTYVDGDGKRTFVFDTASAYQTAQGFVFRAVGGFSDKWSFFGDVGCSNDAADLGSIGTKQDALDVAFGFATYAKTAGHAETATSADSATEADSVPWSGVNARPSTMCSPYFDVLTTGRYYKMLSTHGVQTGSSCNAMLNNAFAGFCVSLQFKVYATSVSVDAYFTQLSVYARSIFETNGYPVVRAYKNGDNDISFILDMGAGYAENGIANCIADFSGVTDRDDYWSWELEQQGYTSVQSSWGTEMTASPFSILKDNAAYYAETAGNASTVNNHSVNKDVPSNAVFTDTDTKVTSAANHYSPSRDSSADKSASASGGSASWSMDVVKGVTLQTDGKGHVTGINVSSGKVPANPFDPSGTYSSMTVGNASKVNNHTVDKDVPSNAVFTDTTYSDATTSASGLMSASDKSKLNGIANNANNYTHPTSSGNKHIPSGGSSGKILRWSADGTATWDDETAHVAGPGISIFNGVISASVRSVTQGGVGSDAKIYINGGSVDSSSFTVEYAKSAASASYATGAANYTTDGTIASALSLRAPLRHEHSASDVTSGTFGASRLDIGMIRKSGNYFVPRMPILWASGDVNLMTSTDSVLTAVRDNGYGTPITVINGTTSSITVTGVYPSKGTTTIPARKSKMFTFYNANNGFFDPN